MTLRALGWLVLVLLFAMLAGDPPSRDALFGPAPRDEAK